MSKKKKSKKVLDFKAKEKTAPVNLANNPGEIAKELSDCYAALKAVATAHNLLDKGLYKHTEQQAVIDSMVFLRSLHQQIKVQALAHPDCEKIPELLEMKTKIQLEALEQQKKLPLQEVLEKPKTEEGKPDNAA